jgi:2'-5' RNA ligase
VFFGPQRMWDRTPAKQHQPHPNRTTKHSFHTPLHRNSSTFIMRSATAAMLTVVPLSARSVSVTITMGASGRPAGSSFTIPSRPTHFLSLRLPSPALHAKVADIQRRIIALEPGAVGCDVEPVKSHITAFVLSLGSDEARIQAAIMALQQCQELVMERGRAPPRVHLKGLGHFGQRVCYASLLDNEECDELRRLVASTERVFHDAGLLTVAEPTSDAASSWMPHLTLLKTSKAQQQQQRSRRGRGRGSQRSQPPRIRPAAYTSLATAEDGRLVDFGVHELREMQLCAMSGVGEDGFYRILASIDLDGRRT